MVQVGVPVYWPLVLILLVLWLIFIISIGITHPFADKPHEDDPGVISYRLSGEAVSAAIIHIIGILSITLIAILCYGRGISNSRVAPALSSTLSTRFSPRWPLALILLIGWLVFMISIILTRPFSDKPHEDQLGRVSYRSSGGDVTAAVFHIIGILGITLFATSRIWDVS